MTSSNNDPPQSVVFIDSDVPDLQDLLSGLAPGVEAFVVEPSSDGLAQIAAILAANDLSNLSSISIVGHGAAGQIQLGSSTLDAGDLSGDGAALAQIGAAVAPGGQLQLYSCDTGSGATGQQFIADLSQLAGVPVAASDQDIGQTAGGENWTLDVTAGGASAVSAASAPFTTQAEASFQGALFTVHAPPTVTAGGTATFTGGGSPVILDGTLSVSDADSGGQLAGATVSIGSGFLAGDTLIFCNQDGINGSYNSDTGVLTLCGTASLYDYQTALDSISYGFTAGGDPTGGGSDTARTISWVVDDGVASSAAATSTLDTVHAAPTVSAGGTATFTGGGSPVILDSTLSVSDADSGCQLAGATVSISYGFLAGDTLIFCNQDGINGSYNSDTGVLTLCGTASLYDYQTALDSISYGFTAGGDPTGGGSDTARTISWVVDDGVASSAAATSTLDTVHAAPTVSAGGTATFTGGGSPVTLDSTLSVSDADSGCQLAGATVTISSGFLAGDTLIFCNQNGINGNYNSDTGELTLCGTASLYDYQTALDSISYGFTAGGDPTGGGSDTARTISWVVDDGVASSAAATSTLDTVHAAPTVTAGGTATFTGGGSPVTLDSTLSVSDADSDGQLAGATVTISSGFLAGDTLIFCNQDGINGSYNSDTGVLTLCGTASLYDYQTALDSISYSFTAGGDPTGGGSDTARTISWVVDDGVASSAAATSALDTVHAPPTVTAGGTATFTGGGSPVILDGTLSVSDADSGGQLAGATVSISSGFISGDTLIFCNQDGINGSYNSDTGVLTLCGTASLYDYQTALDSISYGFTAGGDPTGGGSDTARTISWVVDDGVASSAAATSTLDTVHAPPTVTAGGTATFTGGGSPVTLDSTLSVSDADSGCQLAGATVTISSGFISGDTLIFCNQDGINGSYNSDTGVLTLCGTASLYDYQTALDSISYGFTAGGDPTGGGSDTARTISWVVDDGVASSAAATSTLDTVHAAPTVTAGGTATFTGGGSPVILDGTLSVSDADSGGQLAGATVTISSGFLAGDTLIFCNQDGINGSYNSDTGVLTLCGTASLYDYQTALDSITYSFTTGGDPTGGGSYTSRTISWQVTDGSSSNGSSNTSISALTTGHTAPSVTAGAKASYGGGQAVVLDPKLTVSDADSAGNLSGATVSIGTGFVAGDALHFNTQNGITGSYNSATGVLTLSGTTTLANYQTALDSIAFSSTVATRGSRTIDWQVTDGSSSDGDSNTSTSFLGLLTTPIVTAVTANVNASPSESFAASALFSASDGALILGYEVDDESIGASQGFWVLNGIVLPSGQITELTAGQLSGLSFVAGSVASGSISDTLEVAASDAAGLGPFTTFTVTASHPAPGDVAPVITAANLQEAPNLNLVASSLFSASVPQGETVTSYEVEDTTSDSGHWVFNGVVEPANQLVDVTAAQLSELSFETGYGTDTLMVRANDGTQWGNFATFTVQPPPNPPPPSSTTADMILHDGSGNYEIYDLGKNAILAAGPLGRVGTDWQVAGLGGFNATDTSDMLLRSGVTGAFEIYDISNNNFTNVAAMGQVGLEWQVAGLGDFSSRSGETDMLMRDSATGQFEIYDIGNNTITSAASMGQVGTEWQVAGFGDFSAHANETDMLMRNSNTGQFEIYDISNNHLTSAASMGQVGLEWQVAGFGDFSGNADETDMLMRNTNTGQFEIYDISNNAIYSAASMGQVGLEWQVVGFGSINGAGTSDMLMRDSSTGAFEVYDIGNNQLTAAAAMGQVGTEWSVAGIAADPPAAPDASTVQLAQTMASFAPSAGALAASSPLDQPSMPATTTPNPLVEPGRPQAS